jgi:Flp pilus assembly protein TadG
MVPQLFRRRLLDDESGVAALEFALVLPVLLLLYLGMVQLTALLSVKHKLATSAAVMADLVTRHRDVIRLADLNDYFEGARLVLADSATSEASIRVFAYRPRTGAAPRLVWSRQDGSSPVCARPDAAELQNLAAVGSDIIVVVTCARFSFPVPAILGFTMFPDTITMRQQAIMRPRTYLQINCRDCPTS